MKTEPVILLGWKEIARALGLTAKTAKRWAKHYGLPVAYIGRRPSTTRKAIEKWWFVILSKQKTKS